MSSAGHRSLPHTADIRIEAWAPTAAECLAQAVTGLVEAFAVVPPDAAVETVVIDVADRPNDDALVSVLDEMIFLLDTRGLVPARAEGEVDRVRLDLAPLDAAEVTGAAPKAVTWHELRFEQVERGCFCAVTIDV